MQSQQDWQKGVLAALAYFQKRAAENQPKRKPTWALRLNRDTGENVVLKPLWKSGPKQIDTGRIDFELWQPITVNGVQKPAHHLSGTIAEDGIQLTRHKVYGLQDRKPHEIPLEEYRELKKQSRKQAMEDAESVKLALAEFAKAPDVVMAKAGDHCCICGRVLKDERSMARGIGPECQKFFNYLANLMARKSVPRIGRFEFNESTTGEAFNFVGERLATVGEESLYRADNGRYVVRNEFIEMTDVYQDLDELEIDLWVRDPANACEEECEDAERDLLQELTRAVMLLRKATECCTENQDILDRNPDLIKQADDYMQTTSE